MLWQRDLANCLPFVLRNTTFLVQSLYEGKKEELEVLDTIIQMTHNCYLGARSNSAVGLSGFGELVRYIQEGGPVAQEVFSTFTAVFYIGLFAFLYGAPEMAIESPATLDTPCCYDYQQFLSLLTQVDPKERDALVREFRKNMVFPVGFNMTNILRPVQTLLDKVKEDQQKRYAANAG